MEFSREEKRGGHIWVPGPPTPPRCLAPEGFPTCRRPAVDFLSLGCCQPQLWGLHMQIACNNMNVRFPRGGLWKALDVFHNAVSSRGAVGARNDSKQILKSQNKIGTKTSAGMCHSLRPAQCLPSGASHHRAANAADDIRPPSQHPLSVLGQCVPCLS